MSILDGWDWRAGARVVRRYCVRVGDAVSQLLNVAIFLGDNPNESVSGRSWRLRKQPFWGIMRRVIDFVASPLEINHCQAAFDADISRAARLITGRGD